MAIDVRTKTQEAVAQIEAPAFLQEIQDSLPEGVSMQRFVSVAKTAVRTNGDLVTADRTSLFASIVKCAQDGLLPDGREAALVIYKGKVGYLPMIGGIRRIAAVYGWQIRTAVVYENDEFDYVAGSPPVHRPVRPGMERGEMIASYAVATHRDGRTLESVLTLEDINKRRAKAQTDKVWAEWPGPMAEKSAGHDVFGQLSLDPADARVDRILREGILADPIAALYGGSNLRAGPEPPTDDHSPDGAGDPHVEGPVDGAKTEAAADATLSQAAASNTSDEEEAVWTVAPTEAEIEQAGATVIPKGVHKDKTLAAVAEEGNPTWFLTQLKSIPDGQPVKAAFETFVESRLPAVWQTYTEWVDNQKEPA